MTDLRLCTVDEIGEYGKEVSVRRDGRQVHLMLFALDRKITAWLNVCPHKRMSMNVAPDRFQFNDSGQLVCAQHGATFEIPGGECVAGPCRGARLTAIPVRIVDGWVLLKRSD